MDHTFGHDYWDRIWGSDRAVAMSTSVPNPHLQSAVRDLAPGTALDVGCGAGAEAIWLATRGWSVTGADIAGAALAFGQEGAAAADVADRLEWVQADLSAWQPPTQYDLVTTHYAHSEIPQLELYQRIATWVAPGGTLFIVGHLHPDQHDQDGHGHHHGGVEEQDDGPPAEASATAAAITALLDPASWDVVTARESQRTMEGPGARQHVLHDVVVRARRRP